MKKSEIIEKLEGLGVDVDPKASKEQLERLLKGAQRAALGKGPLGPNENTASRTPQPGDRI